MMADQWGRMPGEETEMTDGKPVWQPIETAPKDGTIMLIACANDHTGAIFARFCALEDVLSDSELACERVAGASDADLEEPDWFFADFEGGGRLALTPTHWMPLPEPPEEA